MGDNRLPKEVNKRLKLSDKTVDVLIGTILGLTIGMHYDFGAFKLLLVALSVVGVYKLAVK